MKHSTLILLAILPLALPVGAWSADYNFEAMIQPAPVTAKFSDPDYYIWCGTMVPQGRVFIYTVWPNMPAGKVPPDDQLPPWAVEMKKRSGNIRTAEFPDRDAFDYATQWNKPYQGDFDKPWIGNICRTRDYTN